MLAQGHFDVTMNSDPPYHEADGIVLARASFDKRFHGPLSGTSVVQMLSARTPVEGSAGYVALECVTAALNERRGSFVLAHVGLMSGDTRTLEIRVVPDSGTGELRGLVGTMSIEVVDGQHRYRFEYTLAQD